MLSCLFAFGKASDFAKTPHLPPHCFFFRIHIKAEHGMMSALHWRRSPPATLLSKANQRLLGAFDPAKKPECPARARPKPQAFQTDSFHPLLFGLPLLFITIPLIFSLRKDAPMGSPLPIRIAQAADKSLCFFSCSSPLSLSYPVFFAIANSGQNLVKRRKLSAQAAILFFLESQMTPFSLAYTSSALSSAQPAPAKEYRSSSSV